MTKDVLKEIDIALDHVDDKTKETILLLLNIIEAQAKETNELRAQLQNLRDEINRLKGEQGKPDIKANKKNKQHNDVSSEKERKQNKLWKKRKKNRHLKIDDTRKCRVDKDKLPDDAQFKGYKDVIVQGLKI